MSNLTKKRIQYSDYVVKLIFSLKSKQLCLSILSLLILDILILMISNEFGPNK